MALLAIDSHAEYNDLITGMEFHTHQPYVSTTYNNNDEIRIPILQQDIITAPFESFIVINGSASAKKADGTTSQDVNFVNNAVAFMFEEIRYEISGKEVDRTRNTGITTTLKNLLSIRSEETNVFKNACWLGPGKSEKVKEFTYSIPLKLFLGSAEDYKRVLINTKQELVLLRAATDKNVVILAENGSFELKIEKIYWRIPHITVNDAQKLKLYKYIEKDPVIHIPFRQWELIEYPKLPKTSTFSWSLKTSNQTEKPRYIVVAFQTDRKNELTKDISQFDACDLIEIKLYLNSNFYPYDNIRGNYTVIYDMLAAFQNSYYGRTGSPILNFDDFKSKCPLYVIDCSRQDDSVKSGPVDVRIEIQTKTPFPDNTWAYCLIIHDCHYTYTPITGDVRKISG